MLHYSLLVLVLAHCAVNGLVNDGDVPKSAHHLASVIAVEPFPVVGLPSNDTKVSNATHSSKSTQLANAATINATQNATSTPKPSDVVQKANITEMGDAKITSSSDPKATDGSSTVAVDQRDSEATKSALDVEPSKNEPISETHLDAQGPPINEDSKEENSKKDDADAPLLETSNEKNPEDNEGNDPASTTEEKITVKTSTVSTQPTTSETEETNSISPSSSNTTEQSSTTNESVTPSSTTSKTVETASSEASASVEATPEDEGMPSGIVALIMAIAFAIVVVIAYVGLLLWRRYLEYRYGTRELLVNDLEFDTNDLRHFEL